MVLIVAVVALLVSRFSPWAIAALAIAILVLLSRGTVVDELHGSKTRLLSFALSGVALVLALT